VSIATRFGKLKRLELGSLIFYAATGILFFAFLPLSGYPPHLAFIGILSIITAYGIFVKRAWTPWIVASLLIINSVFSLYTLIAVGFSNLLVALAMIAFVALTWLTSMYLLVLKSRS
jgi:hypothetical protein